MGTALFTMDEENQGIILLGKLFPDKLDIGRNA
jgi:hypothetical protein